MTFRADDLYMDFGKQADRTTETAARIQVAIPQDGFGLTPNVSVQNIDSDHGNKGPLYSYVGSRNAEQQSMRWYLFPNMIGSLFDGALEADTDEYWTLRWFNNASSSQDKGAKFLGCVFDGLNLTIDRSGESVPLECDTPMFVNYKEVLPTGFSLPTIAMSSDLPYRSGGALIDIKHNAADSFGGDDTTVLRVSVNYQRGTEVAGFAANATVNYDNSWTRIDGYDLTCTVEVTVNVDTAAADWTNDIDESSDPATGALRIALTHPSANSSTSSDTLTLAGGTQTFTVADGSGFSVSEVVCIEEDDGTGFEVFTIDAIVSDDIDFDLDAETAVVAINSASTIQNMAAYIYVPSMKFRGVTPPTRDGRKRVRTVSYEATVSPTLSTLIEGRAYNA